MSEWISVERSEPPDDQVIIRYLKPFFGVPSANYTTAYYERGQGWFYWDDDKPIQHPVTHFHAMPEPPK